jgi:hypothetical protein
LPGLGAARDVRGRERERDRERERERERETKIAMLLAAVAIKVEKKNPVCYLISILLASVIFLLTQNGH